LAATKLSGSGSCRHRDRFERGENRHPLAVRTKQATASQPFRETAGSPEAWLLFSLVVLVLAGLLIPTIFIAILAWSSRFSVQHDGSDRHRLTRFP